jgi:hypothetical protein
MKKLFVLFALLFAFSLAAFGQGSGRLSPDDQKEFDKQYTKWVNDTRKNDRDDIAKDVRKMQEIMARYNIPANVPYEQIASSGSAYPVRGYQGRLSPDQQREFDKHYTKWVNDTRKHDRDDIAKDEAHMREIMSRNNIPPNVPYEKVASTGYANGTAAYPSNGPWQGRLSPDDQREFDRYYSRWVEDNRSNDRDDVAKDAGHMQEIMARYNIPANVPFDQLASRGAYPNNNYPSNAYPAYGQTRLSPDDQREFDKYYSKWVDDTRKNDRDDIDKDTRHMQDIMARYNIPTNVPFDQIASPGAASRY